jgi:hypothetical protein
VGAVGSWGDLSRKCGLYNRKGVFRMTFLEFL